MKQRSFEIWKCEQCGKVCMNEYNFVTHQLSKAHKGREEPLAK